MIPQSAEAEETVLGAILLHPKCFPLVSGILSADDFYHPARSAVYAAMLTLDKASKPIDTLTVAGELHATGTVDRLAQEGGVDYLVTLQGKVASIENVEYHARCIASKASRRRYYLTAAKIAAMAANEATDDNFFADADRSLAELALNTRKAATGPVHMKAIAKQFVGEMRDRCERKAGGDRISGYTTGLSDLNGAISGLHRGELCVVAGRPGSGKSSLAITFVRAAAATGVHCIVYSLEMPAVSLAERMLSADGQVDATNMRQGTLNERHWVRLQASMSRLVQLPVWWEDLAPMTFPYIRASARRWRLSTAAGKPAMVVIDYLGLVQPEQRHKNGTREQEVAEMSRAAKLLAKELDAPVVLLSQLNRELERREDKRPRLSDLRESGAVEQDADVVLMVYRDAMYTENADNSEAEIIIGKQRHGATGTVPVRWVEQFAAFEDRVNIA